MFALLAIPLIFGWILARSVLKEDTRYGSLAMACALGLALTSLGTNCLYRYASAHSLAPSVGWTLGMEAILALLLLRAPRPAWLPARFPALAWASLAAIFYFTATQQVANPDDDYWIHTPLQGLMLHDSFPPTNPFFSEIPMNGHYGRNLCIVILAFLSGLDTFQVQHWMTVLVQCLTFVLLFRGLEHFSLSRPQALLGAGMMFFGINVGGRGGLMDTLQNNNAYVHLYLALYLSLLTRTWKDKSLPAAVLAGLVLGGYAIVYETHYGLSVLATLCTVLLHFGRPNLRRNLLLAFITLAVSVPIAVTQGGPITNIVQRKLSGKKDVDIAKLSKGMQNQSQVVKLTVPKEHIFQVLLEAGQYQRESFAYSTDTILQYLQTPSPGRGYKYIWSWDVLKLHFLPLYLAPFSGWVLLRRRNLAGAWLWSFGCISYLIPALVDFGPIYESEYFRWQFAAGVGFSGALGMAVGLVWEEIQQKDELDWTYEASRSGLRLELHRKAWANLALVAFLWAATVVCGQFLIRRVLSMGNPWMPSSQTWLQRHSVLDFLPIDWKACRWLETRLKPGHRLLTNFRHENNFSILFESTLTGVSGARAVGHALPLDDEIIGTTPYHMAPASIAFWRSRDPHMLEQLRVDWVYLRPNAEFPNLDGVPGLELVHTETQDGQQRLLYHFNHNQARRPSLHLETPAPFQITQVQLPLPSFRGGQYADGSLDIQADRDVDLQGTTLSYVPVANADDVELIEQPLPAHLKAGETVKVPIRWVAPHEDRTYELHFAWKSADGWHPVQAPPLKMIVDFTGWLEQLKVEQATVGPQRFPEALLECDFQLTDPSHRALTEGQPILASIAAVREPTGGPTPLMRGEKPDDLYLLPGVYMQDVVLKSDLRLKVKAMLPGEPGKYQLDLFLSPQQGKLVRIPGPRVEVRR